MFVSFESFDGTSQFLEKKLYLNPRGMEGWVLGEGGHWEGEGTCECHFERGFEGNVYNNLRYYVQISKQDS